MPRFANKSIAFLIALIGSAVVTLLSKNMITQTIGLAWFGQTDPVYNLDISWFVIIKPLAIFTESIISAVLPKTSAQKRYWTERFSKDAIFTLCSASKIFTFRSETDRSIDGESDS